MKAIEVEVKNFVDSGFIREEQLTHDGVMMCFLTLRGELMAKPLPFDSADTFL